MSRSEPRQGLAEGILSVLLYRLSSVLGTKYKRI